MMMLCYIIVEQSYEQYEKNLSDDDDGILFENFIFINFTVVYVITPQQQIKS